MELRGRKSKGRGQNFRTGKSVSILEREIMKLWTALPAEVKQERWNWKYGDFKEAYKRQNAPIQ